MLKPQRAHHYFNAQCNNKEIVRKRNVSGKLEVLLTCPPMVISKNTTGLLGFDGWMDIVTRFHP